MDAYILRMIADMINAGVVNNDSDYIINTMIYMTSIILVAAICNTVGLIFSIIVGQCFGRDIRSNLFRKIQCFSFSNLDQYSNATLTTRLTHDITQVQQIMITLHMLLRTTLLIMGSIIIANTLNKELTFIFCMNIPIIIIIMVLVIKKGLPLFRSSQLKLDKQNFVVRENLAGVRVVRAFMREDRETEKFSFANKELKQTGIIASHISIILLPASMMMINLTVVLVLWFGGIRVIEGSVHVGDIMAYINFLAQILISVNTFSNLIIEFGRGKVSAERINEVFNTHLDITNPVSPIALVKEQVSLEFNNVVFRYPASTGNPVLSNISFSVKSGETVGILGQTGAGKTSLISLILKVIRCRVRISAFKRN